jgi:hypothetical protein
MPPMDRRPAALLALALALAGAGCADPGSYSTTPGEPYCGAVTASSSFRTGLGPGVQMRLGLDASQLDGEASPGTVWTFDTASRARLLDAAPLRRIPTLDNDPLSQLSLGEGRDPSRVFALTPASSAEAPFLAVLSLRSDDGVDVRLLRPGLAGAQPEGSQPVFGLFTLYKQAGTCGF